MTMDTLAVHAGREDLTALGLHALPIDLSTTNPLPNIEKGGDSYEALATGGTPIDGGSNVYARLWNPTVARFESGLAQLEHAEAAVAFASGMAALSAAILAFTASTNKRHVVAVRPLYGGTDHLLATGLLRPGGVEGRDWRVPALLEGRLEGARVLQGLHGVAVGHELALRLLRLPVRARLPHHAALVRAARRAGHVAPELGVLGSEGVEKALRLLLVRALIQAVVVLPVDASVVSHRRPPG